jgi:hypothetical protein
MLIVEDPTVTVKCRTTILNAMLDSPSCSLHLYLLLVIKFLLEFILQQIIKQTLIIRINAYP